MAAVASLVVAIVLVAVVTGMMLISTLAVDRKALIEECRQ